MSTAKRVIQNTGFLYAKMGITMFISLYTTRLILNSLGVYDFGVFNIVGGAIAMLGFLNAAMASATQRFMSYSQGQGDKEKQKTIFNISIVIHFIIAIVVGLFLLIFGYIFFGGLLNIEVNRIFAAKVVYTSLVISTIFTVMTVPYDAIINAHENMLYYSIIGIIESLLKLTIGIIIGLLNGDKLISYGIFMACIPIITIIIMRIYCHRKYDECQFAPKRFWDKKLMKEMTNYASWSLLGASTSMISQYGLGIVLNTFWGAILNAAQGIANQISGQLMVFSNTLMKALNPVIDKTEGAGDRQLMLNAAVIGSKFSYFVLAIFAVPFIIETPFLLHTWLGKVPEWTIVFTRLQLVRSLLEQITIIIGSAIAAKGKIKEFVIVKSILNISPIVLTYFSFLQGYPAYYLYIVWITMGGLAGGVVTVYFANKECGLSYTVFLKNVLLPCTGVTLTMFVSGIMLISSMEESFLRLITICSITSITFFITIYFLFLSKNEKEIIYMMWNKINGNLKLV